MELRQQFKCLRKMRDELVLFVVNETADCMAELLVECMKVFE